ncbi:MAG: SET domain-containing protein [Acidimicrobiia bacterium]
MRQSWLSPLAARRPAGDKGMGIFAVDRIPAGTTVAGFGGSVVDRAELDVLDDEIRMHALQIDDGLFLASAAPFDDADFVNHSCDPNCGIVGSVLLVTMRDVSAGEELCFDYAMTDTDDYDEFACSCAAVLCRGNVTGVDWKEPELRDRYRGFCSAYIERRNA